MKLNILKSIKCSYSSSLYIKLLKVQMKEKYFYGEFEQ